MLIPTEGRRKKDSSGGNELAIGRIAAGGPDETGFVIMEKYYIATLK